MWQKTRSIWKTIYDNFINDFDYFYLCGDDVYLLVENFRSYLDDELAVWDMTEEQEQQQDQSSLSPSSSSPPPRHFGLWVGSPTNIVTGGPGYTLNRAALRMYVESGMWETCYSEKRVSSEDKFMSMCLSKIGIFGNATDTRDPTTGEQRFHDSRPSTLYLTRADPRGRSYASRIASRWFDQTMPLAVPSSKSSNGNANDNHIPSSFSSSRSSAKSNEDRIVGPKYGLDAAAKHSISLHQIHSPVFAARLHAILNCNTCPSSSPLGRGLKQHGLCS
jgi:hypothetical protein